MDEVIVPTAAELAEEEAAKHVPTKEEIRTEIITEFGFDEEADKERIEKAVEKDYGQRLKTSKAIGAKIAAREALAKAPKPQVLEDKKDLSSKDLYALMQASVPEEDVEEVTKAAKVLGVSIAEALKDSVTKTILERRASLRKTAEATNIAPARPTNKKVSGDELLSELAKGNVPDKGSKDAEEIFWAKRGGRRA